MSASVRQRLLRIWLLGGGELRLIETGDALIHAVADCLEEMGVLIVVVLIHDVRVFLFAELLHLLYELRECLGYCLDMFSRERHLHFVGRHFYIGVTTLGCTLTDFVLVCFIVRPDIYS